MTATTRAMMPALSMTPTMVWMVCVRAVKGSERVTVTIRCGARRLRLGVPRVIHCPGSTGTDGVSGLARLGGGRVQRHVERVHGRGLRSRRSQLDGHIGERHLGRQLVHEACLGGAQGTVDGDARVQRSGAQEDRARSIQHGVLLELVLDQGGHRLGP